MADDWIGFDMGSCLIIVASLILKIYRRRIRFMFFVTHAHAAYVYAACAFGLPQILRYGHKNAHISWFHFHACHNSPA